MNDPLLAYLAGGKDPSHVANLDAEFSRRLTALLGAAPGGGATINSGYRSNERQAQLWEEALAKYGDPEIADNWVARPGTSNHNFGAAVDLGYASPEVQKWVHENAARYGLTFPMAHEPWHIEMIDGQPTAVAGAAPGGAAPAAPPAPQDPLSQALMSAGTAVRRPASSTPSAPAPVAMPGNMTPQTNPTITSLLAELQSASMAPSLTLPKLLG